MRHLVFIVCLLSSVNLNSQVFWTETFGGGACSGGLSAIGFSSGNGAWAVSNTGVNNTSANAWFVSAKERGMGVGICGAGCGGTNSRTLHLGSTGLFLDLGAAYNETNSGNATDKRAESPTINCTGKTGITLAFNYMENGQGLADNCTLWYFNGTVWAQLSDPAKTLCCSNAVCTGFNQGLWTAYSIALPVSANNNAAVKIGFRWVNNGNGLGTDPSFAVDDITLSVPVVLPIELFDFSYSEEKNAVELHWQTASEKNSLGFDVLRSEDGSSFYKAGHVPAAGNSNTISKYYFEDRFRSKELVYYKLKLIDKDLSYEYSKTIFVPGASYKDMKEPCFLNADGVLQMDKEYLELNELESVCIYDLNGKLLKEASLAGTYGVELLLPLPQAHGLLLVQLRGREGQSRNCKIIVP
jgi:hypothetical protein